MVLERVLEVEVMHEVQAKGMVMEMVSVYVVAV